jgi:5-methylcytosine-specific restriction endonuclease McrA
MANKSNHRKKTKRFYLLQGLIVRDNDICVFCNKKLRLFEMTLEHIVPKSLGGYNYANNLTISCRKCNNSRGTIDFFYYLSITNNKDKIEKFKEIVGSLNEQENNNRVRSS